MLDLGDKLKNKNFLIYGFARTGKSCFNYLKKNNKVFIFDDNKENISNKLLKTQFIEKGKIKKKKFDFIVISPGIDINKSSLKFYLKKYKDKIITDLDIFYLQNLSNLKITITGTNGKSTTAKLLFDILKKHKKDVRLLGNIGKPILSEKDIAYNTIFVIEASSYQIEYSKFFKTDHAMILNISPDHLERHGTIQNYVHAKFKLILKQNQNGFAYIDLNNKHLKKEVKKFNPNSKIINVQMNNLKNIKKFIKNPYFTNVNNLKNLSFIMSFGKIFKLDNKKILNTVNNFKGLNFRQQIILSNDDLIIINDSKSTSFSSSINLLKSYKNIFWLVGGIPKKGDVFILPKKYYKNIKAYIFGNNIIFFKKLFLKKLFHQSFKNLEAAVKKICFDINKENDRKICILFSPAAASFDQFKNFEDRGKYFNKLIKKIKLKI